MNVEIPQRSFQSASRLMVGYGISSLVMAIALAGTEGPSDGAASPPEGQAYATGEWVDLFDGETLHGWRQLGGKAVFEVRDGAIVGISVPHTPNSFLCTDGPDGQFEDFELEFEVLCGRINSGVQIRSQVDATGRVNGPQVEIEPSPGKSGFVFGEGLGIGWLSFHPGSKQREMTPHRFLRNNEWNHYLVVARGPRIQVRINGHLVEELDLGEHAVSRSHRKGFIGLQVHNHKSPGVEIQWRNLRLRKLHPP